MKNWLLLISMLVLAIGLAACGDTQDTPEKTDGTTEGTGTNEGNTTNDESLSASAELKDSSGNTVGNAELTEEGEGVRVKLNAQDLPEGMHGIHFHEVGKCEAPDFESAGGHFNPTDASHGMDQKDGPHAGDLPNLEVGEDGTIDDEFIAEHVTLKSGEGNSLLKEGGTALVIHAEADDGKTQPSGDSGDRIACGVVE